MTCPCGQPAADTCAECGRRLCAEHRAWFLDGAPGCLPECRAPWWSRLAYSKGSEAQGVETKKRAGAHRGGRK